MGKGTIEINDKNFEKEVVKSEMPVLVDFWAQWCGPCKAIAPVIETLSVEYAGKMKFCKLDIDHEDCREIPVRFAIRSIPTLMIFRNGEVFEQLIGAVPKDTIKNIINKAIL